MVLPERLRNHRLAGNGVAGTVVDVAAGRAQAREADVLAAFDAGP